MWRRRCAIWLVVATAIQGCHCAAPQGPVWKADDWVRTELYFGMSMKGTGEIDQAEWERFVEFEVTPRFPDGLTVIPGSGQWKSGQKIVRENTRVLIVMHPRDVQADKKIEEIREAYKKRFGQESVMRVDEKAKVGF